MSDETTSDLPPAAETVNLPALRREALLPNERSRGLGTVAVVCTMAGVASGLALATTLMAMQVADTMSSRSSCSYRGQIVEAAAPPEHGFLGIRYVFSRETNATPGSRPILTIERDGAQRQVRPLLVAWPSISP